MSRFSILSCKTYCSVVRRRGFDRCRQATDLQNGGDLFCGLNRSSFRRCDIVGGCQRRFDHDGMNLGKAKEAKDLCDVRLLMIHA